MQTIKQLLQTYPRQRPELSEEYKKIYIEEIQINRGKMCGLKS